MLSACLVLDDGATWSLEVGQKPRYDYVILKYGK
jgi:hypothetical protein